MITGAGKDRRPGDVSVADLAAAGLAGPSMVRVSKLATIEPARILRGIGSLARAERRRVSECLEAFLARA
jgi:hypothetical protein